jgi:hypothetical protein
MIEAIAVDEIQASAGAQVSSASVPLSWMNRSGRVRPEFVEKEHSQLTLLLVVRRETRIGCRARLSESRRSGSAGAALVS